MHGGVTLGGFASTGDLFIDILKNGVSLGIGSTTKNIGIGTVARTSVTTGVVEVSEADYFELAIRVIQDTSVSLQPVGTFFSCHASSTEIGGSSPDTNYYVDHIGLGLSGQDLTLTLGRTGNLPSISGSITLPSGGGGGGGSGGLVHHFLSQADYDALTLVDDTVDLIRPGPNVMYADANDYVTAGAFSLVGQDLSLQLTGTSGFPTIDIPAITLPAGTGMGGGISEAEADARYLQLIGGTLASPGRLTIDVNGNAEALIINHHGGLVGVGAPRLHEHDRRAKGDAGQPVGAEYGLVLHRGQPGRRKHQARHSLR